MEFGLGYSEMAVIAVIALIVIGPKRLPELMRTVGKVMGQVRRASDDLRREILFSDELSEVRDLVNPLAPPPLPPPLKTKNPEGQPETETPPETGPTPPDNPEPGSPQNAG